MKSKRQLLLATALVGAVAFTGTAMAQNGPGNGNGGNGIISGAAAPAAEGGVNQRWAQEQTIAGSGAQIVISPASVRLIQQALNRYGYGSGQVDGVWHQRTSAAAADFERSVGLEPTGTITTALIQSLGLGNIFTARIQSQPAGTGVDGLAPAVASPQSNFPWLRGAAPQGMTTRWIVEAAVGPGEPLYVSPADVRLIQQALNQRGYNTGAVSGNWNQLTSKAVADFQRANNLAPDGRLDLSLISALGLTGILTGQGPGGAPPQAVTQNRGSVAGQRWAMEATVNHGVPLFMGPAGVRMIHVMLNRMGFDAGHIKSAWNRDVDIAMADFEHSVGLEPTGTPTTTAIAALGLANWTTGQSTNVANSSSVGNSSNMGNSSNLASRGTNTVTGGNGGGSITNNTGNQ